MRRASSVVLLTVFALGVSACQDTSAPDANTSIPPQSAFVAQGAIQTFDDRLAEIADADPSFAGIYASNGKLIILATRADVNASALLAKVNAKFQNPRFAARPFEVVWRNTISPSYMRGGSRCRLSSVRLVACIT